jgi:MFS family permease
VVGALVLQIAGMAVFIVANGVGSLFVARILQGAATGAAAGAIGAWLIDLQPPNSPGFGGLVGGVALMAGIGAGALGSSVLVQYAPNPVRLVYWLLLAVYATGLVAVFFIPDVVERRSGASASLRPKVGVPQVARSAFAALSPALVAAWALGGLYLSLGPSLAASLLKTENRLAGGVVIAALALAGAAASAFAGRVDPRAMVIRGSLVLVAGVGITLFAVAVESTVLLYVGSFIAGLGLGPAFSGVLRSLAPLAPPDKRGALLASIYIVLYLSFSVPTVLAGIAVAHYPLRDTTYVYGVAVMALAAVTTIAVSRTKSSVTVTG